MAQPQPSFDYQGALTAGYSEDEIDDFLKMHQHDSREQKKQQFADEEKRNSDKFFQEEYGAKHNKQPVYETPERVGKEDTFSQRAQKGGSNIVKNAKNFFGNFGRPVQGEEKPEETESPINLHLLQKVPNLDVKSALESGYSHEEINEFLKENQPERPALEKGGRIAGQYALGAAENALLPYELGVAPLASKEAMNVPYREDLGEELDQLMHQKASGQWTDEDEKFLQHIQDQIKDPHKSMEFAQTANLGVRELAEKATGLDLHPEGVLEKAAGWTGFLRGQDVWKLIDPKKMAVVGLDKKSLLKTIIPSGEEVMRGLGAGAALQAAMEGEFGPIGTIGAVIAGDLAGIGVSGLGKGAAKLITQPKQTLAKVAASFTPKDKLKLQKDIIKDFREAGLQADIGTLTDSNLVKAMQARLMQSGLTGKALDDLRNQMEVEIKDQYKKIANELGNARFQTIHEASEAAKDGMKAIRETHIAETRELYANANKALKDNSFVNSDRLASSINKIEKELKPGQIKSAEQSVVLNTLEKLKRDLYDSEGNLLYAKVKDLMNNKIALNDIINYEVQGGSKQLLKGIVAELDRAIVSHGKENPIFASNYIRANKQFSEHAKIFRNKNMSQLLSSSDSGQILNRMNSVQGIRDMGKVLNMTSEGRQLFNDMKRFKLDQMIDAKMVDNISEQLKFGKFSNLLKTPKDSQIALELLGKNGFSSLARLQKATGKLAATAQKFFNASKSGATVVDAAIVGTALKDLTHLLTGNPWPLAKRGGAILGARYLTRLIADPEFLKLVEEAILASEKNEIGTLLRIGTQLEESVRAGIAQTQLDQGKLD